MPQRRLFYNLLIRTAEWIESVKAMFDEMRNSMSSETRWAIQTEGRDAILLITQTREEALAIISRLGASLKCRVSAYPPAEKPCWHRAG